MLPGWIKTPSNRKQWAMLVWDLALTLIIAYFVIMKGFGWMADPVCPPCYCDTFIPFNFSNITFEVLS